MPFDLFPSPRIALGLAPLLLIASAAIAKQPADLAGTWDLSLDRAGTSCRVMLRAERSDKGDYFLGMPPACRHAMPGIEVIGRWAMPDDSHLTLDDPAGTAVLTFAAEGSRFTAKGPGGTYALKPIGKIGGAAAGFTAVDPHPAPGFATVQTVASGAVKGAAVAPRETTADLAGRYAVMREKRDTGCMLTLDDKSRAKGAERAQLAPGCRDQGIVIFDPSAWQLVKGELVLIARAGHKTHLEKKDDGTWQKDPKDGKPLGLKKL